MRNLIKFLPLVVFPIFSSVDSKAQTIFTPVEDLPLDSVYEDFRDYQNTRDVDTLKIDTTDYDRFNGFKSELLYLDINKDSAVDVVEFFALKGNRFSGYDKTPAPWKYVFFGRLKNEMDKDTVVNEAWIDLFINGLDGTEIREKTLKIIEEERKRREILDRFLNPKYREPNFYNPQRKVDI